jgi:hypothetical protein
VDVPKSAGFNLKAKPQAKPQTQSKLIPITIYVDQKEHQALSELAQALYSTEIPNPMIQQKQRMLPSPKVEELVLAAARQTLMNFIMEQQRFLAQQQQPGGVQYPPGYPQQQQQRQPPANPNQPQPRTQPTNRFNPKKG